MGVVLTKLPHIHGNRGDRMEQQEYVMTKKYGNTTVHFVAPAPMTDEEKEKILNEYHWAAWAIIDELIEKGEDV